jgi:hypothetical protein
VGLPRVADALVAVPADALARALMAVEESYRQSARDLGYDDGEAQSWVDAMMFRLRSEVQARQSAEERSLAGGGVSMDLKTLSA